MSKNIMVNKKESLIDRGIDKFSEFVSNELSQVTNLASQVPDQAYVFHGSYDDSELTQAEIKKATDLLVRMELGVEEEAPVVIVFEYAQEAYRVIDFATEQRKHQAQSWLESFRKQSQQAIEHEISR